MGYIYLEWGIYIWSGVYISGVGYIYLEWGIYIWSGVYISGVGYIYLEWGIYISCVGFIYLEQMTDFETYGTPYVDYVYLCMWTTCTRACELRVPVHVDYVYPCM